LLPETHGVKEMKVALYARFSTDLQRIASIEDQFRNCRKRAELEGWQVVSLFADPAMSGSDANRPQYRAMLEAAARREFDILLVDDLARLTRDSVECERVIRRSNSAVCVLSRPATATIPPVRRARFIAASKA
jgi:site-specific DNA recombinase